MTIPADCKRLSWKRPRRARWRRWFDFELVIVRNGQQRRVTGLEVYVALLTMVLVTVHAIGYVAAIARAVS